MKIRVLIVEPSPIIVDGLVHQLQDNVRLKLLTPEASAQSLPERVVAARPDVLLVNAAMAPVAVKACEGRPCAVLGLVYQYIDPATREMLDDIIDIHDSRATIVDKIMTAAARNQQAPPDEPAEEHYELTRRETAVLIEVAKGLTNKEIADKLDVSTYTVISHRKNIVAKTGIKSVAGLTVYALLNNLIDETVLK